MPFYIRTFNDKSSARPVDRGPNLYGRQMGELP